jgi:hypothetical protein
LRHAVRSAETSALRWCSVRCSAWASRHAASARSKSTFGGAGHWQKPQPLYAACHVARSGIATLLSLRRRQFLRNCIGKASASGGLQPAVACRKAPGRVPASDLAGQAAGAAFSYQAERGSREWRRYLRRTSWAR